MTNSPNPTILVVEDEPFVRLNAVEMIEDAGWNALEASDAAEALRIIVDADAIEVLFTDINMPGDMDGLELAERVHSTHPEMQLVVTSGKQALPNSKLPDDGTFLAKPYGVDDLIEVIRSKVRKA